MRRALSPLRVIPNICKRALPDLRTCYVLQVIFEMIGFRKTDMFESERDIPQSIRARSTMPSRTSIAGEFSQR
jgi:hypothetical protein